MLKPLLLLLCLCSPLAASWTYIGRADALYPDTKELPGSWNRTAAHDFNDVPAEAPSYFQQAGHRHGRPLITDTHGRWADANGIIDGFERQYTSQESGRLCLLVAIFATSADLEQFWGERYPGIADSQHFFEEDGEHHAAFRYHNLFALAVSDQQEALARQLAMLAQSSMSEDRASEEATLERIDIEEGSIQPASLLWQLAKDHDYSIFIPDSLLRSAKVGVRIDGLEFRQAVHAIAEITGHRARFEGRSIVISKPL